MSRNTRRPTRRAPRRRRAYPMTLISSAARPRAGGHLVRGSPNVPPPRSRATSRPPVRTAPSRSESTQVDRVPRPPRPARPRPRTPPARSGRGNSTSHPSRRSPSSNCRWNHASPPLPGTRARAPQTSAVRVTNARPFRAESRSNHCARDRGAREWNRAAPGPAQPSPPLVQQLPRSGQPRPARPAPANLQPVQDARLVVATRTGGGRRGAAAVRRNGRATSGTGAGNRKYSAPRRVASSSSLRSHAAPSAGW